MPDLKRGIRALSNPARHATALLRIVRAFRNWGPLLANYVWRRDLPSCEAVFRDDGTKLLLSGLADLSNLWAIFGREEYPVVSNDELIIDIGANIGLFSLFAARRAPDARITAFEPVKPTFDTLATNVGQSTAHRRISLINAAVAPTDRRQRIYLGTSSDLASLYPSLPDQSYEWVEARSINTILRDHEGTLSLLKMDCEGAEWEILTSAQPEYFKKVQRVFVEFHDLSPKKMQTALGDLARLGFRPDGTQYHGDGQTAVVWASRTDLRHQ
jgi:FkbM family methyltransferase